ncbi:MAG: ATP-binding protein [Nitrospira sp.]|nr:ATP-binding protein [Nitrospira sp.]MDH5193478.1 ATP-binding protein [Nitrospira sp.]
MQRRDPVRQGKHMAAMTHRDRFVLAIAAACFLIILIIEQFAPANVVVAYGYVLPILLVATFRNRTMMLVTVLACVVATYSGLLQPTKPGRFQAALINRSVVVSVLLLVAYLGMSWEERKAREEAARLALAKETESLLKANTQLVQAKDQLNRSERLAAVGQLVASVAHEVGTPLHSIAWHVQALAEEPGVTPEMKKRVAVIDEQLARVVRIIQDLLSSTRPRQPEPEWLSVEEVVSPSAVLMEPAFHEKGLTLTVDIPKDLPFVWADREKIHQVLVNVLANALAATPAQGTVTIVAGCREASADELERGRIVADGMSRMVITIVVQDTGCGMPAADLEKAFEPFFTTKAVGKGTGLGLFLSRESVVAHGGGLVLRSVIGQGTTVTLTLPAMRRDPVPVKEET